MMRPPVNQYCQTLDHLLLGVSDVTKIAIKSILLHYHVPRPGWNSQRVGGVFVMKCLAQ